jgi:hypothetical protein
MLACTPLTVPAGGQGSISNSTLFAQVQLLQPHLAQCVMLVPRHAIDADGVPVVLTLHTASLVSRCVHAAATASAQ